ncbi:NAD(P)/FAD-dependent oxidoreductase [Priestia filamentosa]|uniref:nitrite reductase large subunit NirB n=1 Tax=Priestia filamentosa TaxID=1402861 RepID=UPI001FB1CFA1|nr:nitrite reductase large subunit NirB [Priestia filamentosa]MED3727935.1 nitrite reductase large subunit NirB [Priestia filamentosa]UOE60193.1 NAD(P)/FAD-dependent oxidoreductase [Priestia filamentosa]
MQREKLVLIGNGMAGIRCIEEILKQSDSFDITVFGAEPYTNYNRILLSTVLQGDTSIQDIMLHQRSWYEENRITLFTEETVTKINRNEKTIFTDQGRTVAYDKLIIATGSSPFILPIPGADMEGVKTFRTIKDCEEMIKASEQYKKAVVIGGGLLGLEAARGLMNLGMKVDVVHLADALMNRQLDMIAAKMLKKELERQGMNFLLEKNTAEIVGNQRVEEIHFTDGSKVEADLVVMAAGVKPNVEVARESGLTVNRGIVVNDYLQTEDCDIYAVGECCEHNGIVYGLVKPLYEQGRVLADHICQQGEKGYRGTILSTQLKISGVDLFSVGDFEDANGTQAVCVLDETKSTYKKLVFKNDILVGAVLFGSTKEGPGLLEMIIKKQDVSEIDKLSLLQSGGESSAVCSMAQEETICHCNNVTKGAIIEAVTEKDLQTIEEVKSCTKASSSCGGCKPLLTELFSYIKSDDFEEFVVKQSMCQCTTLTEDEVIQQIQEHRLTSFESIVQELKWSNKKGCLKCQKALQYYLKIMYPELQQQKSESGYPQLQKDGTYSLTPQFYGGLANIDDLQHVLDVAKKYNVSDISFSHEQRIELHGIKRENIREVLTSLHLPILAQDQTMVTIKRASYRNECECEQKSIFPLSYKLDQAFERLTMPNHLAIGLSSCVHEEPQLSGQDILIIGEERGFETYTKIPNESSSHLLFIAKDYEESVEMMKALIQYYRETASYLEEFGVWVQRLTDVHIREVLFEQNFRDLLCERLHQDQSRKASSLQQ